MWLATQLWRHACFSTPMSAACVRSTCNTSSLCFWCIQDLSDISSHATSSRKYQASSSCMLQNFVRPKCVWAVSHHFCQGQQSEKQQPLMLFVTLHALQPWQSMTTLRQRFLYIAKAIQMQVCICAIALHGNDLKIPSKVSSVQPTQR